MQKEYGVQAFNRLYKELDDLYHDLALRIGVSDSALAILYTVCRMGDGCLQKDVCEQACISKQTVNSGIQKLIREGYLYLMQGNRRDKQICLTERGKQFSMEHICPLAEAEDSAFSQLTPKEQTELIRLVSKYVDIFSEKMQGPGSGSKNVT